ncbi:MAG: hypothetical protein EOO27_11620 [Comamonadaceae bacterium]|nr:MAG: hypothetical protein EOO27_11620 [Comamonadaceae bacterium]
MITFMTVSSETTDEGIAAWEVRLREAARSGEPIDLASDLESDADGQNPALADAWGTERQIPAAALRSVLIDPDIRVDPRGLCINGARVTGGPVDLSNLQFKYPIRLVRCRVDDPIDLTGATLKGLALAGSHISSLFLDLASIDGGLFAAGITAVGQIRALGARIAGELALNGATLSNPRRIALSLDGLTLEGGLFAPFMNADGEVRALNARIGGQVTLRGATLTNTEGIALHLDGAAIDGGVFAQSLSTAKGAVRFTASGEVRALNARIRILELDGATINSPGGVALSLDRANIEGALLARSGFTAVGELRALNAEIGGQLSLNGASLTNPGGIALYLDGATIDGGVLARSGFTAEGEVRALKARIGTLELSGATLTNPEGIALHLDSVSIAASLLAGEGFNAAGEVRALHAHVGGQLSLSGATLNNPDGHALNLDGATLTTLLLADTHVDGTVDLTRATITDLRTPEKSIPEGRLVATGWRITDVHGLIRTDRRAAEEWLNTTPANVDFTAQPWNTLAAVYDRNGQPADARRLRFTTANKVTKHAPPYSKPLRWLYLGVAGHGYYPLLAALWLAIALCLGSVLVAFNRADFIPTDMAAAQAHSLNNSRDLIAAPITASDSCDEYPGYPCFEPLAYTLTNVIPASSGNPRPDWRLSSGASIIVTFGLPILRILSWVFTAILLAGVTGLLRKT